MNKLYILILFILTSCAQFVPPTGGPKDIVGPKILDTFPKSNTKNFKEKEIQLTFDELIDVTSLKQEIIITPQQKGTFQVKPKGKSVKLIFDENFEDSTTYTINFRNGIKDLTEKNPGKNLKLVFSTGPIIDSLKLEGTIVDINTKLPEYETTVGLYKKDTTAFLKRKPTYFTKTDSLGKYTFENIKKDKYSIIAFNDKNQNLTFDQKNEKIGFEPDTISLFQNYQQKPIEIYPANFTKNRIRKTTSRETEYIIQTDKPFLSVKTSLDTLFQLPYTYTQNTINIFKLSDISKDTLNTQIILIDSLLRSDTLNQKIYFTKPLKTQKIKIQTLSLQSNIKNGEEKTSNLNFHIKFDSPITKFDSTGIIFKTDTVITEKPEIKWINKFELNIQIKTKAKNQTELIFKPNTFINYKGDTNNQISIKNIILQPNETAKLQGRTEETTGTKIVQLINSDNNKIYDQKLFTDKFTFVDIIPGTYIIKIIFDDNKNGIWDPGNIFNKKMPEKIIVSKEPIKIKANFEIKDMLIK